jgi:hypothetical protein
MDAKSEIKVGAITKVLFESEKDKVGTVQGRVIFDLDRYLLLFLERSAENSRRECVIAIPHERIKSIQTPPLPQSEQKSAGD